MQICGLYLHPIKSCGPIAVASAEVDARGFAEDRRWMLVDEQDTFVTLRSEPRLALLRPALVRDRIALRFGTQELEMPRAIAEGPRRVVRVWQDQVEALEDEAASAWVSAQLGRPLRMVYMPDDVVRAAGSSAPAHRVGFADAYPLLLLSRPSVAELSRRIGEPVDERRFRPNVVIDGAAPHAEDALTTFTLGALRCRNVKPCERCVATTVDPVSGDKGREPLRTLATYRRVDGKVLFGVNIVVEGTGTISIGDALREA